MPQDQQNKICPKCGKPMEEGYVPDRIYHKDAAEQAVWASGKPEKRFFGGIDLDGKATLNITTFRCLDCGFLESYASD